MKTATPTETKNEAKTSTEIPPTFRVLKIAHCPSLSGKSELTYHLGCKPDSDILVRVYDNSSTGYFSKEWIALSDVQQLLVKAPKDGTLTSFVLMPLFKGKSINTPPFLFAALLNEGLVKPSTTTRRCYECTDGKTFFAKVKELIASKVDLRDKVNKPPVRLTQRQLANIQELAEEKAKKKSKEAASQRRLRDSAEAKKAAFKAAEAELKAKAKTAEKPVPKPVSNPAPKPVGSPASKPGSKPGSKLVTKKSANSPL